VIMQENRAFDSYFGTFPGLPPADRLPLGVCIPDPFHGGYVKPFVVKGAETASTAAGRQVSECSR